MMISEVPQNSVGNAMLGHMFDLPKPKCQIYPSLQPQMSATGVFFTSLHIMNH